MKPMEDLWSKRLQQGNAEAFSMLFECYHRQLYALAFRYTRSGAEAEDAVQHTFMKLWEKCGEMNFSKGVNNLLFTILKHYLLNELRHEQVMNRGREMLIVNRDSVVDPYLSMENEELSRWLNRAIDQLPKQKKEVCRLKLEEELSNQEIADRMQIELSTVKTHYTQAIKQLSGMMRRYKSELFLLGVGTLTNVILLFA